MNKTLKKLASCLLWMAISVVPAAAQQKMTVAFSTVGFAYLPALVAKSMDLYRAENFDADIVITGGETKALAGLIGGGVDVYLGSAPTVIRARENGAKILMVGNCVSQYATNLVLSSAWVKAHSLTEKSTFQEKVTALKGATLGITAPGSGTDLIMRFLARKAGLNPDRDMTLSTLGGSDTILAAFAQGRIDGFALSAPVAENAVKNHGAVMVLDLSKGQVSDLDGFLYTAITFREDVLDKAPDVAVRFLRVQQRALDAIRSDATTDQARDAVWKMYWPKVDKALFDEMWLNWKGAWPKTVEIREQSVQQMVDFTNLVDAKKIEPRLAAAAWTNKYAVQAISSLHVRN